MKLFFISIAILLIFFISISVYRLIKGPSIFDRLLAAGAIGSKTMLIIIMLGLVYDRLDMFVDITVAYAVLNFIGTIVMAKYFSNIKNKNEGI